MEQKLHAPVRAKGSSGAWRSELHACLASAKKMSAAEAEDKEARAPALGSRRVRATVTSWFSAVCQVPRTETCAFACAHGHIPNGTMGRDTGAPCVRTRVLVVHRAMCVCVVVARTGGAETGNRGGLPCDYPYPCYDYPLLRF